MHSGWWRSPGPHRTSVRSSLTYRQNLLSPLKTTERHSTLQSTLSGYQSSRSWRCRGVSGNLIRGTRNLSPTARRRLPMNLGDTEGATWAWISSPDAVRASTAAGTVRLYYAAVQNLVNGCGNIPQTTAESSDTPPIYCAQHVQQSVDMSIQLPPRPTKRSH